VSRSVRPPIRLRTRCRACRLVGLDPSPVAGRRCPVLRHASCCLGTDLPTVDVNSVRECAYCVWAFPLDWLLAPRMIEHMFEADVDPDAFLAWLDSVDEQPPPVEDEVPFQDEFADPVLIDPTTLSVDRQLGRLVGIEQQISALGAEQQVLLAAINDGDSSVDGWSSDLVSCALRVPPRQAQHMIATARTLIDSLPRTFAALTAGEFTVRHVEVIAEASWRLPSGLDAELEAQVIDRAATQTVAQLRASIRRSVLALDPEGAERRHRTAREQRIVERRSADDGMAELRALLPAPDSEAIYRRLSDATRLLPAVDERTAGQQRADLLVDAVLSGIPHDALPEHHGRRPNINIIITASTLLGQDDHPGWLDSYGPITADQARLLAADPTGTWRRIITDPVNEQLLDYGTTVYRPPQALADHVIARDPVCAFPTCN
jgi:hypothetical protein